MTEQGRFKLQIEGSKAIPDQIHYSLGNEEQRLSREQLLDIAERFEKGRTKTNRENITSRPKKREWFKEPAEKNEDVEALLVLDGDDLYLMPQEARGSYERAGFKLGTLSIPLEENVPVRVMSTNFSRDEESRIEAWFFQSQKRAAEKSTDQDIEY